MTRDRVEHRARLRRWEFDLIASALSEVLPNEQTGRLRVLEFGCGAHSCAEYLSQFGALTVTDTHRDPSLSLPPGVEFEIADIHCTKFRSNEFDVLVASHVLPCLADLNKAFAEMRRIGKEDAYYAFSVPTSTWLVLSIPAKLFKRLGNVFDRIKAAFTRQDNASVIESVRSSVKNSGHIERSLLRRFTLGGVWYYTSFSEALRALRIKNWRHILLSNGFRIIKEVPLLTYADSDIPIIPPVRFAARL